MAGLRVGLMAERTVDQSGGMKNVEKVELMADPMVELMADNLVDKRVY